jgi:hypothetical protein
VSALPEVGSWASEVPDAPHSKEARTLEIDAEVAFLKTRPGEWRLVYIGPGRSGGPSSSFRGRGCEVKTRHRKEQGATEVWARWPA